MAATLTIPSLALCALLLPGIAGCAGTGEPAGGPRQRGAVGGSLEGLKQGLQAGTWSRVERFFSPDFRGGYGELRDRLERRFRDERLIDLQFIVNRVLESDGIVNAQVRWHKVWVDKAGKTGKTEGVSEFILKPAGDGFRILGINGDPLF